MYQKIVDVPYFGSVVQMHEKLHPQGDGVFGHWELGMGHGKEHTNAQCPMPQAAGRLSLYRHLGMEFPAAFNENCCNLSSTAAHQRLLAPNLVFLEVILAITLHLL